MKRSMFMVMVLCLCFMLCIPGKAVLAATNNTQITTKITKKVTKKKKKMEKKAKKTSTFTKKTTTKKKSTKKSSLITTVIEKWIVVTTKIKTKKNSKTKSIITTIVTTVKTTQIISATSSNTTSNNVCTKNVGFSISKLSDINGHVHPKVYNAFNTLGFTLKINPSLPTTGRFSVNTHDIQLKRGYSSYLLHEMGHFLSVVKGHNRYIDQDAEFKNIYQDEKNDYIGNNKAYVISDSGEYFAESFCDYTENPSELKIHRPRTYDFINKAVNSLSDNDIAAFRNNCSPLW